MHRCTQSSNGNVDYRHKSIDNKSVMKLGKGKEINFSI